MMLTSSVHTQTHCTHGCERPHARTHTYTPHIVVCNKNNGEPAFGTAPTTDPSYRGLACSLMMSSHFLLISVSMHVRWFPRLG